MKNFKRVLSLALAALMVIGGLVVAPVDAKADAVTYTQVDSLDDIVSGDSYILVAYFNEKLHVVTNDKVSGKDRIQGVEASLANDTISYSGDARIRWTIEKSGDKYLLKDMDGNYRKFKGNGFGATTTTASEAIQWNLTMLDDGTIQFQTSNSGTDYFLFGNSNNMGWDVLQFGAYKAQSEQYAKNYGQSFYVFKLSSNTGNGAGAGTITLSPSEPVPEPQPTVGTIAEALAGAEGTMWTVKGVVTLVDGKNIYIQDATGGIDAYFGTAPTDIALGDTIEVTGSRDAFNGLEELANATYTKSTGLTLAPKTTTIGALTTADVGTYVKITGLTVTELVDKKDDGTPYSSPNLTVTDGTNTIKIYKAVVEKVDGEWAIQVGDKIDVLAAVGINYSTLQLRNTLASEITVVVEEPDDSEDPSESESESESQAPSESESAKEELTAKDILAEAAKLEDGQYLGGSKDVKYTLKGVITKYEFNEQYGDASITIKVDGTDETFYCYQVKGEDVKNLKVGDRIELNGAIKNYKGTIEFERPNLVAILPTGDFSSVGTVMILIAGVACLAVAFTSKKRMA